MVKGHHGHQKKWNQIGINSSLQVKGHYLAQVEDIPTSGWLWAGYGLAIAYLLAGHELAIYGLSAIYGLVIN